MDDSFLNLPQPVLDIIPGGAKDLDILAQHVLQKYDNFIIPEGPALTLPEEVDLKTELDKNADLPEKENIEENNTSEIEKYPKEDNVKIKQQNSIK